MRCRRPTLLMLALLLPLPRPALGAREGTLAVINMRASSGHELVGRAAAALEEWAGGWARQPAVVAYLAGRPQPGALPAGDAGKEITVLVDRVRTRKASSGEMASLGRLLGVDYLLLIVVRARGYTARLFSVHRGTYAPASLESSSFEANELRDYLRQQTRPSRPARKSWLQRWWVVGLVAVVGGVTLGLALANRDQGAGELRVRATR